MMYGVSRATARAALADLQRESAVVRRQGAGTYVTHAAEYLDSRLEGMRNCEDMSRALSGEPSVGWLEHDEALPDPRTAEALQLAPDEGMLVIRKVFLGDGTPVIHYVDYLPLHLIQKPFTREDLAGHAFAFLEEFAGERACYYVAELMPTAAYDDIAERLQCPVGTPLLLFDEVAYNIKDKAISRSFRAPSPGKGTPPGRAEQAIDQAWLVVWLARAEL